MKKSKVTKDLAYYQRWHELLKKQRDQYRKNWNKWIVYKIEADQKLNRERQYFNQEITFLKEMIKLKEGTIEALKMVNESQLNRIEGMLRKRPDQDQDYDPNDLQNIMRNKKASSGEMSEDQINELIEQKRRK